TLLVRSLPHSPRCSVTRSLSAPSRPQPTPPLFPYTTLFRSPDRGRRCRTRGDRGGVGERRRTGDRHLLRDAALVVPLRRSEPGRSEEHTSELQSRFDLVCRLLLEKKKRENRSGSEARADR